MDKDSKYDKDMIYAFEKYERLKREVSNLPYFNHPLSYNKKELINQISKYIDVG